MKIGQQFPTEQASILIVDDSPGVVKFLRTLLEGQGYRCTVASSTDEARAKLAGWEFALVLSDVNMPPGESGLGLIRDIFQFYPDTAAILVTGQDDPGLGAAALEWGAYGYIIKPFNSNELLINVANALIRRRLTSENREHREKLEQVVLKRTRELLETIGRLEETDRQLSLSQEETIQRLAKAAEFRDNETAQHIQRMSLYSGLLARQAGLEASRVELIRTASPMHDIGKIGILDSILMKPGKFTPVEFEQMKRHAEIGYRILSGSESKLLNLGAIIARTHHEKWDGSGYPEGLAGADIPLEGRITAIADVFDALTNRRVYKTAMPVAECIALMTEGRGRHFDPALLDVFVEALPQVLEIKAHHSDCSSGPGGADEGDLGGELPRVGESSPGAKPN